MVFKFLSHRISRDASMILATLIMMVDIANAAQCGNTSAGFPAWVKQFKQEAENQGIQARGLSVLDNVHYSSQTIYADRHQKSFKLSLNEFMKKRGAQAIINRGKMLKEQNAKLFANIEQSFGVPAGPLIAIWGMETNFGKIMGNQHTLSAVATLAYDCRRSDYFIDQLYAALKLIQRGDLDPTAVGAMHGEIGQTQFLPVNVIKFGVDGDGKGHVDMIHSKADALVSTANFLVGHGWRRGVGYQLDQPNFAALQGWNSANVYQQTIAIIGKEIDD